MAILNIVVDKSQRAALERDLAGIKNGPTKVLQRAISKVAKSEEVSLVRFVASHTKLTQKTVREKYISLKKPNYRDLSANIRIKSGKTMSLMLLKPKWDRSPGGGVSYIDPVTGQRTMIRGAFIANTIGQPKGYAYGEGLSNKQKIKAYQGLGFSDEQIAAKSGKQVFSRLSDARLPIERETAPSVVTLILPLLPGIKNAVASKLQKEVETQAAVLLEQQHA